MDDWVEIGILNVIDTARYSRGEITLEQAAAIARSNTKGEQERFAAQMADAGAARQRNREWLGIVD